MRSLVTHWPIFWRPNLLHPFPTVQLRSLSWVNMKNACATCLRLASSRFVSLIRLVEHTALGAAPFADITCLAAGGPMGVGPERRGLRMLQFPTEV